VTSVTAERGSSWTVAVEPVGHAGFTFEPGQFSWLTLRHSPFAIKEHPFSMSTAPHAGGMLEFTIKELGDFTRTIKDVAPGETAYVDGPYGAFSADRYPAPGYVFIGGGIGMAPIMSMLRALAERGDRRPHVLFMANGRWERVTFREAVDDLERRLELRVVHLLEEPPAGWTGERGYVTAEILARSLPAPRHELEYFLCNPQPMIDAVERALYRLGVPLRRCHSELFDLV
jgi:predicted ferric reductase